MSSIQISDNLTLTHCPSCGVAFAYPDRLDRKFREYGESFYCPSGHPQSYTKSEVQRLREQLEAAQKEANAALTREQVERDQRLAAERERDKEKRASKRIKRRAAAGLCPCCNRSFENVKQHLATKHPEFAEKFCGEVDKLREKANAKEK